MDRLARLRQIKANHQPASDTDVGNGSARHGGSHAIKDEWEDLCTFLRVLRGADDA